MRNSMAFIFTALAGLAMSAPAPYPVTVNSRAQTAPPVTAYRGNESTFRVSFVDGSAASDLTGVVPFMAWATNASATVNSTSTYAVVGSATNGVVDFTFSPEAVNYTPYRYMYEVGVKSTSGIPRVYRQGTFTIAGSPIGGGASAFVGTTNISWAAFNWIGLPSWLLPADTNGWETGSHAAFLTSAPPQSVVSVNGQTGAVVITASGLGALTAESDPVALAALADLKVTRWYDSDDTNTWAEWAGGTNIVFYRATVSGTNFMVTLSDNFLDTYTSIRPNWTNNVWPFSEAGWAGVEFDLGASIQYVITPPVSAAAWSVQSDTPPSGQPLFLLPSKGAQGTATVSIASYVYGTTNELYRYYLPTNAIPPELTSLDLLQAWLNNLYATTAEFNAHTTNTEIHVTAGQKAVWDAKADASITNGLASTGEVAAVSASLSGHTNDAVAHVTAEAKAGWDAKAETSITNGLATTAAPAWISVSNAVGEVTVTNDYERPVTLYATGDVAVAFTGLRPPLPVWLEAWAEGTATVSFADAYAVGGFLWQTNRVNLFAVWASGTNTFITPVTTRSKE